MREWFSNLAPREQWMVGAAAVVLVLMIYFLMVWEPLSKTSARLDQDIVNARELVIYMQKARKDVAQLGGSAARKPSNNGRSLLAQVDSSGKRSGVANHIKRIQPEGQNQVRLWLEDAPFEALMNWLNQLQQKQGIVLENGSLDRDDKTGTVKARLTLMGAN
ncbi:MAG: type II secretion system protein GspM [Oceanococcus sp.]